MKKSYYNWADVETAADAIMLGMYKDTWMPDVIVGITRGGLPLALLLSHRIGVPMETLKVQLRDGDGDASTECNLWLPEMAFGYVDVEDRENTKCRWDINKRKNILIVDDINDTGATFNWIKNDWQSGCFPNEVDAWKSVWHKNVKFAAMTQNWSSDFQDTDYYWDEVNKAEDDVWLVYPWERDRWLKKN